MDWKKWLPSSKMTAVFVSGWLCVYGVWALRKFYGIELDPVEVSLNMMWILFVAGYSVTENRPK